MKRMIFQTWIFVTFLLVGIVHSSQAAIVNRGFETGILMDGTQ